MTPEGKIKAKVKRALAKLPQCYHFMPIQNGMGAPSLDFINCINGKFVAIETKVPGKLLTERQQRTARMIFAAGGSVFVIRDDMDIAVMLAAIHHGRSMLYDNKWLERYNGLAPMDATERTPDNDH